MNKILVPMMMAGLLDGCSLVPDYRRPAVETPQAWHGAAMEETKIAADWWKNFSSDELNILMDQSLARNLDLRAAIARIEQSRAAVRVTGATLMPMADASGGLTRTYNNPGSSRNGWHGAAGVGYELDLFGANRAGVAAAAARLRGSAFDHDALALVVMSDVAKQYFSLLNLRERVTIAESNLKISRDVLDIITARFDAGADSNLELSQQKTAVANNEASLAALRRQAGVTENALALLLSYPPQALPVEGATLERITVPHIAAGQPSALLERRPDIRAAEAGLQAANADIGAARAAFFPSINLGLDAGIAGNPVSRSLSLASSVLAPIFSGGRLEGNLSQSKARQAELAENYRKTVLTSFQEVEDALGAARAAREREISFAEAREQARISYDLSLERYKAGSIDYQSLLDTQRSLFNAQDAHASVRLEMLNAAVDLYKALGGGWASAPQ